MCAGGCGGTHHPLAPLPPAQAHELLVLAGDEVDGRVFQQGGEDKEQAHSHPDVSGLHVGDLQTGMEGESGQRVQGLGCSRLWGHGHPLARGLPQPSARQSLSPSPRACPAPFTSLSSLFQPRFPLPHPLCPSLALPLPLFIPRISDPRDDCAKAVRSGPMWGRPRGHEKRGRRKAIMQHLTHFPPMCLLLAPAFINPKQLLPPVVAVAASLGPWAEQPWGSAGLASSPPQHGVLPSAARDKEGLAPPWP